MDQPEREQRLSRIATLWSVVFQRIAVIRATL